MNKKKAGLSFGWTVFVFIGVLMTAAWATGGFTSSQAPTYYGSYDSKDNVILRVQELTTDTLKGVEAGTTGQSDMHGYTQFSTFIRVHEWDADTGSAMIEAQVSCDGSNWVRADTQTVRTTDSTLYVIEWTLPPALYFRVIWTGLQNAVDSTLIDNVYHLFQQ